ncbi:MAG: endonuclease/exonuclease/phosphatase family protein, partial [Methanoregula sp.]
GGRPLGFQMTIKNKPIARTLSVLTYNTHLFKGSGAAHVSSRKLVEHDDERADMLLKKLSDPATGGADIVFLQEVWGLDMREDFGRKLGSIYPYVYIVPDIGFTGAFKGIRNEFTGTSGLIVASRYQLLAPVFQMYHDTPGDDQWAKKGIVSFFIVVPYSRTKYATISIGNTHAPCDIPTAQRCIAQAAAQTFGNREHDVILGGDFNLHFKVKGEYADLQKTMNQYKALDIVSKFLPSLDDCYTDWPGTNKLSQVFDGGGPNPDNKDRIDYIYFAAGKKYSHLIPKSAKVFHDWKLSDGLDVSDHYPVRGEFLIH